MQLWGKENYRAHKLAVVAFAALPLALNGASSPASEAADDPDLSLPPTSLAQPTDSPSDLILARAGRFGVRPVLSDPIAPTTTLIAKSSAQDRAVKVSSPKGERTWDASSMSDHNVPMTAKQAYQNAARQMATADPSCGLSWTLLAGIGRVESDHGRYGGSTLGTDGVSRPLIIGVALNGVGPVAAIRDSDDGRFDKDTVWDRAVGPMQFIPTTWAGAARDGDGDGTSSPNDIDDAALAAAGYLCAGSGGLGSESGMRAAIFRYNPSDSYVDLVMAFERGYRTGDFVMPTPPAVEPEPGRTVAKRRSRPAVTAVATRSGGSGGGGATSPAPSRPKPSSKPTRKASAEPSPAKSTTAKPSPSPTPVPETSPTQPAQEVVEGKWLTCSAGASNYCLDAQPLDLSKVNGDFAVLEGRDVRLSVVKTGAAWVVYEITVLSSPAPAE